jgi:hypothetical protein
MSHLSPFLILHLHNTAGKPANYSLGVCLTILQPSAAGSAASWRLTEAQNNYNQPNGRKDCSEVATLASGLLPSSLSAMFASDGNADGADGADDAVASNGYAPHTVRLEFSDAMVTASIDNTTVASTTTSMTGGVAGLNSGWNTAFYDKFSYRSVELACRNQQCLLEILYQWRSTRVAIAARIHTFNRTYLSVGYHPHRLLIVTSSSR